jgi:hypothetical protein
MNILDSTYSAADIIALEESNLQFRTEVNSVLRQYMILSMSDAGIRLGDVLSELTGIIAPDSFPDILVDITDEYKQLKYSWFEKTYQDIKHIVMNASLPF